MGPAGPVKPVEPVEPMEPVRSVEPASGELFMVLILACERTWEWNWGVGKELAGWRCAVL